MLSCDTIALGGARCASGHNTLAKNSDRPLGESQPLVFIRGGRHEPRAVVKCTHMTLPQADMTFSVIGAKPYWIWGFETGLNECGVMIGNEAQGSRCEAEKCEGLLGMDILRLALERSPSARDAVGIIADLIEQFGQNANANMLFDRRYENSYMIVDDAEIWLMETAGRQWVAKRADDWYAISNCYTIGSDFDLCSSNIETYARERRWLADDEKFDFARAYTAQAVRQTNSVPRWRRLCSLIESAAVPVDCGAIKEIMRDHFSGEINAPRYGSCCGGFATICMHAMTWDAAQTASSMTAYNDNDLGPVIRYAPSVPCCSVYVPVYLTGSLPQAVTLGGDSYSDLSLWWCAERLASAISIDEERFGDAAREKLLRLEADIEADASSTEEAARALIRGGKRAKADLLLNELMSRSAEAAMGLMRGLASSISADIRSRGGLYGIRKEFLEAYCARVNMPLF